MENYSKLISVYSLIFSLMLLISLIIIPLLIETYLMKSSMNSTDLKP